MELQPVTDLPFADAAVRAYLAKASGVRQAGRWRLECTHPIGQLAMLGQGGLTWSADGETGELKSVLAPFGKEPWHEVRDWSVDDDGRSVVVAAGHRRALFDVHLDTREGTQIGVIDERADARCQQIVRIDADHVLLVCERSLRLFRRTDSVWTEVTKTRLSAGASAAVGVVQGEVVVSVITINHGTGARKVIVYALRKHKFKKLDEALAKVWRTHIHAGEIYVDLGGEGGWHRARLAAPKPKKSAAKPKHPLLKATIDLVPCDASQTPDAIREALLAECNRPRDVLRFGRELFALRDDAVLRVWRNGGVESFAAPTTILRLDVSPDGAHAIITTGRDAPGLWERRLDTDAEWRAVDVAADASPRGLLSLIGVARFDVDHLVVESGEHLILLCRQPEGSWVSTHRVKAPQNTTLRTIEPLACVAQASPKGLTLYGLAGERLKKLTKTALPTQRFSNAIPRVGVSADGRMIVYAHAWLAAKLTPFVG